MKSPLELNRLLLKFQLLRQELPCKDIAKLKFPGIIWESKMSWIFQGFRENIIQNFGNHGALGV